MKDGVVRDLLQENIRQGVVNLRQHNAIFAALSYLQRGQSLDVVRAIEILVEAQK